VDFRKRKPPPQEEGAPAWMNTYGDMVTLLLTFFVLLFSFSTIDAQKWEKIVSSLSGTPFVAIQAIDPGGTQSESSSELDLKPTPTPSLESDANMEQIKEKFDELYEKIKTHIEVNNLGSLLNVEEQDNAILIRMSDSALFDSGKDFLKADAKMILGSICVIIEEYDDLIKRIRVEGHTDNVPIHNSRFEDNWELSASRALVVVRYMLSITDLQPQKLIPMGYGEYHPVDSNETAAGRASNRRVDFVIESILKD